MSGGLDLKILGLKNTGSGLGGEDSQALDN